MFKIQRHLTFKMTQTPLPLPSHFTHDNVLYQSWIAARFQYHRPFLRALRLPGRMILMLYGELASPHGHHDVMLKALEKIRMDSSAHIIHIPKARGSDYLVITVATQPAQARLL
jgi:hypothetical protein